MFLRRGGSIDCQVTGARRHSEDLPQGGLEIPGKLILNGNSKIVEKVVKIVACALVVGKAKPCDQIDKEKENEPPNKKINLSSPNADINIIASGKKWSDLTINLAQQLLKTQFPSVNGLWSTLLQTKSNTEPFNNQLQIIHSSGDHWIVASTGCKDAGVLVYEYVYNSVNKASTDIIGNLFPSTAVSMADCQKQEGGTDCGNFAIAYATAIAHGVDPYSLQLKQAAMCNHLVKCFKQNTSTFFP